ncbi:MAG: homoserine O-succinyltransferase [Gemmatimonadaceae bacterium]
MTAPAFVKGDRSLRSIESPPAAATYEIIGPYDAPVVAVLGGISSSRHVASSPAHPSAGWWEGVVGPGLAIDTRQFRVLSIDYFAHESHTGPVTTNDQADALALALDKAGIEKLHAVVGASYGGMVALAFGAAYASRAKRLIVISAAHESDPMTTALRHLQRQVVELGTSTGRERDALVIARGIAMTSYLTPRYLEERIADCDRNDPGFMEDRIANYLRTSGEEFAERWTSGRYNALSLSLDLHSVRPEDIAIPTTVLAIAGDRLVPIAQTRELARRLGGPSQLIELDSALGHDAFLEDSSCVAPFINELLRLGAEDLT